VDLKPQNNTSSVTLTAHEAADRSTNTYSTNNYSISQQFTAVMNWMRQFYPDTVLPSAPPKKPSPPQQTPIKACPPPPSISEIITDQKYSATHIAQLEDQFFIYQQSPEWDTHTQVIEHRANAL
jgi:hypothetical protein